MKQLEDVRKYTHGGHGGHVGTGTGPLDNERRTGITFRRERDHIVAALRRGEGMIMRKFPDPGARTISSRCADVTQHRAARLCVTQTLRHFVIKAC